jgi:hypothetical protein
MQVIRLDRFQYTELQNNFFPKNMDPNSSFWGKMTKFYTKITDFWKQYITFKLDNDNGNNSPL